MPGVSTQGMICSGHGCFPPRPATGGHANVRANGAPVLTVGSEMAAHACGTSSHAGQVAAGHPRIRVNGQPVARLGDAVDCGSILAECEPRIRARET